jgi:transposase
MKGMKKKTRILKLWKTGMSKRAISKKVEVSRSYVCKIINQQTK